jgi:sigma-E factor negative regulatory protein RseB
MLIKTAFLMCFLPSVLFAQAESETVDLLAQMSKAMRNTNYEGRFMYAVGSKMSSFQIQHAIIDDKEHERLVFLNKKMQEVVRVGHDVFCVHTGNFLFREHEQLKTDKLSTNPFSEKLESLNVKVLSQYQTTISENEMVAGRDAYKIAFEAKDDNRYNHYLWIDKDSHLLLKTDISDPMLGVLESFEFVQIRVGVDIPKREFEHENFVRHQAKHMAPHGHDGPKATTSKWQVQWVPEGFSFSGEKNENNINMLMFTDGLAAITIFIEPVAETVKFSESSQKGALSAYTRAYQNKGQSFMVTGVGEVPLAALERITRGLSYSN